MRRFADVWWIVMAGAFMLAYALVTPPFQAPDEVGHYWRSYSLARGTLLPHIRGGRPEAEVPRGVRDVVATLWVETAGRSGDAAKVGLDRLRKALEVPLAAGEPVRVSFFAYYTPVPHLPQTLGCIIGDLLGLRPLFTFYLARLLNAACALLLFAVAVRIAPSRWPFVAIALLPMLLYLCGSLSADAVTTGMAFLTTALALRGDFAGRRWGTFLACAFLLALCKPVYLLLPLLALVRVRDQRLMRVMALGAVIAAGAILSAANARHNPLAMRTDVPVSPRDQMINVRLDPLRFVRLVADDYRHHGTAYLDHFVGRLGWLDVPLPQPLVSAALVLLVAVALTSPGFGWKERLAGLVVVAASLLLVSLSQYLAWSAVGGDAIDGVQGRYFLPLGPILLLLLGVNDRWSRIVATARVGFVATAIVLNAYGVSALVQRYY